MAVQTLYIVAPLNNPNQIESDGSLRAWKLFNAELKAKDYLAKLEETSEYTHDLTLYEAKVNLEPVGKPKGRPPVGGVGVRKTGR